jgi:hypothetical protein
MSFRYRRKSSLSHTITGVFICYLILSIFFLVPSAFSADPASSPSDNLIIDLKEPELSQGVLTTEKGGTIRAEGLFIQAECLSLTRKGSESRIIAEGNLILQFGEYYFVGERLEYDFILQEGVLYGGRTAVEPWFFGGEAIYLHSDGSFTLVNGFITTSENRDMDWALWTEEAHLREKIFLTATNLKLKIWNVPIFWFPKARANLQAISDAPIRYDARWGGRQGARISMSYQIFAWERFKTFFRLDYRFKRGLGGGVETYYRSEDRREIFNTVNFIAHDNSLENHHQKIRYRFQGLYHKEALPTNFTIDITWDKLSDKDMATDYNDRGLELDTAGKTQFQIRKEGIDYIARLFANVKINTFQTIKQELPTFALNIHPWAIGRTGLFSYTTLKASYLDFSYSNNVRHVHDYNAPRVEGRQTFYRPFTLYATAWNPGVEWIGIYYGNSPQKKQRFQGIFHAFCEASLPLSKQGACYRHVVEPYLSHHYYAFPLVPPREHYIFDIEDGWYGLNATRLGVRQFLFFPYSSCPASPFFADLYTFAFFDVPRIHYTFPVGYLELSYLTTPWWRNSTVFAWDIQHGSLHHFNYLSEWTVSSALAIKLEYRHRNRYAWRKSDPYNFIMEAYRRQEALLHSPVSDRRDTLLSSLFYQFHPNWGFYFEMRHGWHRLHEPSYTEFETDLIGTLPSAWNVKLSYQHREADDRVAVYFSIGLQKPSLKCYNNCEALFNW